jgi:hypothetical protein
MRVTSTPEGVAVLHAMFGEARVNPSN